MLAVTDDPLRIGVISQTNRLELFGAQGKRLGQAPEIDGVGRILRTAPVADRVSQIARRAYGVGSADARRADPLASRAIASSRGRRWPRLAATVAREQC